MTERELERRAKHKLAVLKHVEEVSGSVSATCRYYGISRTCYYKWLKRYEDEGFLAATTGPTPWSSINVEPRARTIALSSAVAFLILASTATSSASSSARLRS